MKLRVLVLVFLAFVTTEFRSFAEDSNIDLQVTVIGNGSHEGINYIQMYRYYQNKTGETQLFSERLSFTTDTFGMSSVEANSISEGLSFVEIDRGFYEISGELKPNEKKSINIFQITKRGGGSKGRDGAIFGHSLDLLNAGENLKPLRVDVIMNYPENAKIYENQIDLIYWNDEGPEVFTLRPRTSELFPNQIWSLLHSETVIEKEYGEANVDLHNVGSVRVDFAYAINLNSTPNYITYIALGVAICSLLYTVVISRRVKSKLLKK